MLVYNELDNFMKTLETRPKDLQIAVEIKKEIKDEDIYTGTILVHYIWEGYVHGYMVSNVASFKILNDSFFDGLRHYVTEDTVKKISDIYEGKVSDFNTVLLEERTKIVQVLTSMGFANIADIKLM